jgi:hypothetical protein
MNCVATCPTYAGARLSRGKEFAGGSRHALFCRPRACGSPTRVGEWPTRVGEWPARVGKSPANVAIGRGGRGR